MSVLYKTNSVTIGNTAAKTTVFSTTVNANSMGATGLVRWKIFGNSLNNSGAGRTFTLTVEFGSATLYQGTSASLAAAADRRPLSMEGVIQNTATNAQLFGGSVVIGSGTAPTSGLGAIAASIPMQGVIGGSSSEDTTANKTLTVSITHSTANANLEMKFNSIVVELIPT